MYCIKEESSIRETMEIIDRNLTGSAVVVDSEERVLGIITDGDIRRALLQGKTLEDGIVDFYMKNIKFQKFDCGKKKAKDIMMKYKIRQLPVIDKSGRLVKLYFLDDIISYEEKNEWVVIQAGGLGSRLRPLTDNKPKPLLKIGDKPVLEHIMDGLIYFGYRKFIVTLNYKGDMIEEYFGNGDKYGTRIEYVKEKERLGTAGALSLCKKIIDSENFIVVNGDILTGLDYEDILRFHKNNRNDFTAGAYEYNVEIPYGVIESERGEFLSVVEKPQMNFFVNSGIYVLNKNMIEHIQPNTYIGMTDVMESAKEQGKKGGVYPIKEFWRDIGKIEDYNRTNSEANNLI